MAGYFLGRNLGYFGGAASFNLPSVVGQQVAPATTKLQTDGLVVKTSDVHSNDAPGTVISTDPPPNALVQKGNTVTLKVATAPPVAKVAVPAGITNTTLANAKAYLQAAGLNDSVTYKTNNAADNTVLSASPSSGTKVPQGSTVDLTVSSGPANVPVPSVAGLSQQAAVQPPRSEPAHVRRLLRSVLDAVSGGNRHHLEPRARSPGPAELAGHAHRFLGATGDHDHDHDHIEHVDHHDDEHHQPGTRGRRWRWRWWWWWEPLEGIVRRLTTSAGDGRGPGQTGTAEVRKLASSEGPLGVSSDSGWNWTPSTGNSR